MPNVLSSVDFDRDTALARLRTDTFDVVVIGGGVTGCGVALDAAARGLRTALVEANDFASGTSSKSSKLVHGGLRYLQQHEYRLVYEALAERQRLIANAPHLVHPLPFLIPLFGKDGVVAKSVAQAYSVALWLYDVTGGLRIGHRHQRISAGEALAHFPLLRTDRLVASFLYWDAQTDDARLTLALARTAARAGAAVVNYAPVAGLLHDPDGSLTAVHLVDGTEIATRAVVNAGGVWSEEVARMDAVDPLVSIRPAKGIHITVPAAKLPCDYASVLAVPGDKRSIFVVPWDAGTASGLGAPGRYTYLGTTDTDYDGPLDDPQCSAGDVAYVLDAVNAWTTAALTPADVTGSWAGLRPLVSDASSARTADLSRRHKVLSSAPTGVVTVTGGKLTTYRKMAADTVDAVVRLLRQERPKRRDSPTRRLPLVGATGLAEVTIPGAAARFGVSADVWSHLVGRYGAEAPAVLALAEEDPGWLVPLAEGLPYLRAEVVFAARHEMARTVTDVLARRTRALILNRDAALTAAPDVARLLRAELGWSDHVRQAQMAEFVALTDAERTAGRIADVAAPATGAAGG
ncbi:MAG: glycerol-3-phosphate dehydrogenase/oxidase [Acidimicrobiales bacterium]